MIVVVGGAAQQVENCPECGRGHRLTCSDCQQVAVQHRVKKNRLVSTGYCRPCLGRRSRASKAKRPEHYRQVERYGEARRRYGLTPQEVDALGDTCRICEAPGRDIDHCHATGKVRGLLCNDCNRALGLFRDDAALLRRAADYLEMEKVGDRCG